MIRLDPIETFAEDARIDILYALLLEREGRADVNISHRELPSKEKHAEFVRNHPYGSWDFISLDDGADRDTVVGAIYLTKPPRASIAGNELGVFVFWRYQGMGYGGQAVRALMQRNGPGRYLANINPANVKSMGLFTELGFHLCQCTLGYHHAG